MIKKLTALILAAAAALSLCGCGSLFDEEYVTVSDYVPAVQDSEDENERITVRNITELKQAILTMVAAGDEESSIFFDAAYDGDATEDLASACWQVRSQDALCAYCVENIAYELNKIVTYYEARLYISYSDTWQQAGSIVQMQYSTGLNDAIKEAFEQGNTKLVILINRSSYSAENMENLVSRVYRRYPASAPREPRASVNMLSGTGMQRLYEININYGMAASELELRRGQMAELQPFAGVDLEGMSASERALVACRYLADNCLYTEDVQYNNVYSALIRGEASSEGLAFAYVELCRQLDVSCQIVYGQRNWQDYCWNILEIEGEYYHVDIGQCVAGDIENGFILRDQEMWQNHRWDVSAYPHCAGELTYEDIIS